MTPIDELRAATTEMREALAEQAAAAKAWGAAQDAADRALLAFVEAQGRATRAMVAVQTVKLKHAAARELVLRPLTEGALQA